MMSNTTAVRPWPTCGDVVDRRPADVHRHLARLARGRARRCRAASVSRIRIMAGRGYVPGASRDSASRIRGSATAQHGDAFAAADRADALAALGLRPTRARRRARRRRFVRPSRRCAARARGCLGVDHDVDVARPTSPLRRTLADDVAQQLQRRRTAVALVGRGEQGAEVGQAGRAEQRVGDRVGDTASASE